MTHGRIALFLCASLSLCVAAHGGEDQTIAVSATTPVQGMIVQGDPLPLCYRVEDGGQQLSATAFVRRGSLGEAPKEWHKGAIRSEPKYQISRQDMRGKTKRVRGVLPGHTTKRMAPGKYTAFVAIANPPTGWQIVKLGELEVRAFDRVDVPKRQGEPSVAIWRARDRDDSCAAMVDLVKEAGCAAVLLPDAQIADPATLRRDRFDLLVLPDGSFPVQAQEAIAAFLRKAGSILTLGGPPLAVAPLTAGEPRVRTLADFEAGDPIGGLNTEHGPRTLGSIAAVADGAAGSGHSLRGTVAALKDWFYVAVPLHDTGGAADDLIRFWAKGDAHTDRLCLELNEDDGSRWKYFVHLTTEWQEYSVRMTDFAVYASPERMGLTDHCRPEQTARLKLGFYRALFEDGRPRTFWVDEIRRGSGHVSVEARAQHLADWAPQYAYLKARPPALALGLLRSVRPIRGTTRIASAHGQHTIDKTIQATRQLDGWEITPVQTLPSDGRWSSDTASCSRHVPLLEGFDAEGRSLGVLASLVHTYRGPYRGSTCAFFCVGAFTDPEMRRGLLNTVRRLTAPVFLFDAEPRFSTDAGRLRQTWSVSVVNPSRLSQSLSVQMQPLGSQQIETKSVTLIPGEVERLSMGFAADDCDLRRFGVRVLLKRNGQAVDELVAQADALNALTAAGDWLRSNQEPTGQFSRFYYADTYGARAMRVLATFTHNAKYGAAALRMTDMLVREQRADGGWWVGYGPPGDCVFVADDGCIALALVQLAAYVDEGRRREYLGAARKFIEFRESFRITSEAAQELTRQYGEGHRGIVPGGLGVGYVRTDYFAKKPYGRVHREMRQFPWTLHCSLAFLGGLHSLAPSDEVYRLAAQDTRWFLARVAEGKDSVRSPYANEAAVWMLDTLDEDDLRGELSRLLRDQFLPHAAQRDRTWWTSSGGRGALLLPGLVYCSRQSDATPATKAALARALWSLCGSASPLSLPSIVSRHPHTVNGEVVMYVCFSSLGLAELLQPRSTMLPKEF